MEYFLIYLLVKLDSIRAVFDMLAGNIAGVLILLSALAAIAALIGGIVYAEGDLETEEYIKTKAPIYAKKSIKVFILMFVLMLMLDAFGILLPSPKEAAVIIGGGATLEILSSDKAKEIGGKIGDKLQHELDKYLSIPEEAPKAEAKVEGQGL